MAIFQVHNLLFGISGGEILIILLAVLLLFGPKKIPEIARMIGRGINEVKKVQREINSEIHRYTADIENEARSMQQDINKLTNEITKPANESDLEIEPGPRGESIEGDRPFQPESPPMSNGQLPYPYNEKTGDGI